MDLDFKQDSETKLTELVISANPIQEAEMTLSLDNIQILKNSNEAKLINQYYDENQDSSELPMAGNFIQDSQLEEETKELELYREDNMYQPSTGDMYQTDIGCLKPLPINHNYKSFQVSAPMKNGTYITYQVSGTRIDSAKLGAFAEQQFTEQKRYSDFVLLKEILQERWIGFFIPAIPPKKTIGNMDKELILERKSLLNSFIRQLAKYKFLVDSPEFSLFANYTGDKLLQQKKSLQKELPGLKLQKYQTICPIEIKSYTPEQKAKCKQTIEKFNMFIQACLSSMKTRKKTHEELAERRETQNKNYKVLLTKLNEYEKTGLDYYGQVDQKSSIADRRLMFTDQESAPDQINHSEFGNPYKVMYQWIIQEIQDLKAMKDCTNGLSKIEQTIKELQGDIFNEREFLIAQQQNKTTLQGIWLKVTRREQTEDDLHKQISVIEQEIEDWQNLLDYLIVYIPMVVIPRFKMDRGGQYFHFLNSFAQNHIRSCNKNIEQWRVVLEATKNLDDDLGIFQL